MTMKINEKYKNKLTLETRIVIAAAATITITKAYCLFRVIGSCGERSAQSLRYLANKCAYPVRGHQWLEALVPFPRLGGTHDVSRRGVG